MVEFKSPWRHHYVPLTQRIRVGGYEPSGHRLESCRERQWVCSSAVEYNTLNIEDVVSNTTRPTKCAVSETGKNNNPLSRRIGVQIPHDAPIKEIIL